MSLTLEAEGGVGKSRELDARGKGSEREAVRFGVYPALILWTTALLRTMYNIKQRTVICQGH